MRGGNSPSSTTSSERLAKGAEPLIPQTAVLAKRAGFETLLAIAAVDSRLDAGLLERLIAQADKQHDWLADARREVAAGVFGGDPGAADAAADS